MDAINVVFAVQWLSDMAEYVHNMNITLIHPAFKVNVLHFMASLLACKICRQKNKYERYWLESLMSCYLFRFGGTTALAILLGQPPGWMFNCSITLALFLAWWLTFCCPGDFFWRHVAPSRILQEIILLFDAMSQAHALTSWGMDRALFGGFHNNSTVISNGLFLNIVCGLVASNGGGILADVFCFFEEKSYCVSHSPTFLSKKLEGDVARIKLTKCFVLSCFYFLIIKMPSNKMLFWLPDVERERALFGHLVIIILQLFDLFRLKFIPSLDIYGFVTSKLLFFAMIPRTIPDGTQRPELSLSITDKSTIPNSNNNDKSNDNANAACLEQQKLVLPSSSKIYTKGRRGKNQKFD